jgi:hypothetical protein
MSNDTLHFIHTFSNGETVTLTVERTGALPRITCKPPDAAAKFGEDYFKWRAHVTGLIRDQLTPEERAACVASLLSKLTKQP